MSVLVGRLLFWTCLLVCSSQIHCYPNCVVRCAHLDEKPCPAPQLLQESTGCREVPSPRVMLSITPTQPLVTKMLKYSQITTFFHKHEIRHFCWNETSWSGHCVMPCVKQVLGSYFCVCCEGRRGKVLQRAKTSAAEASLSWMIRVWSLGVHLSNRAPEVDKVNTDPFPCNHNQNTVTDREDFFLSCLAKYNAV